MLKIILILVAVLIQYSIGQDPLLRQVEYKATRASLRIQKGEGCKHNDESKEECAKYAAGESSCDIIGGDRCQFTFFTDDNQGWEPIEVSGAIGALYLYNVSSTRVLVSGMVNSYKPSWSSQVLDGIAGKPVRYYYKEKRGSTLLDYEWIEYTIWAEYDPKFATPPKKGLRTKEEKEVTEGKEPRPIDAHSTSKEDL